MKGRKRKPVEREPNGRPQRVHTRDYGTDELQQRRVELVEHQAGGVVATPVQILQANGLIDEDAHRACAYLAWLHRLVIGGDTTAISRYDEARNGPGHYDEEWLARREEDYDRLRKACDSLSRAHRDIVWSLVCYERMPAWLKPDWPWKRPKYLLEARKAQGGITAVAREYEALSRRRKAA